MSSKQHTEVRHVRVDRRQIERGQLADEDFFIDLLNSFPHDENNSDIEDHGSDTDEVEPINNEENLSTTENDENRPSTSGIKRKRDDSSRRNGSTDNEWEWVASNFEPKVFHFDRTDSGITRECGITENSLEFEYLFEFFDNVLIDLIVEETNRYQRFLLENGSAPKHILKYSPVTREEIIRFLCIIMLMSHVKKHSLAEYWTTCFWFETKGVRLLMSRDRFLQLL